MKKCCLTDKLETLDEHFEIITRKTVQEMETDYTG